MLHNFYVSTNSQATNTNKGLVLFICMVVIVGLNIIGFQSGGGS